MSESNKGMHSAAPLTFLRRHFAAAHLAQGGAEQLDIREQGGGLGSVLISKGTVDIEVEALISILPLARVDKQSLRLIVCDDAIAKHGILGGVKVVPVQQMQRSETGASTDWQWAMDAYFFSFRFTNSSDFSNETTGCSMRPDIGPRASKDSKHTSIMRFTDAANCTQTQW